MNICKQSDETGVCLVLMCEYLTKDDQYAGKLWENLTNGSMQWCGIKTYRVQPSKNGLSLNILSSLIYNGVVQVFLANCTV